MNACSFLEKLIFLAYLTCILISIELYKMNFNLHVKKWENGFWFTPLLIFIYQPFLLKYYLIKKNPQMASKIYLGIAAIENTASAPTYSCSWDWLYRYRYISFANFPLSLRNTKGKASSLLIRALGLAVLLAEGLLHSSPPSVGSPAHTLSSSIHPHQALPHYHFRCSTNECPISIHALCDDAIMQNGSIVKYCSGACFVQ